MVEIDFWQWKTQHLLFFVAAGNYVAYGFYFLLCSAVYSLYVILWWMIPCEYFASLFSTYKKEKEDVKQLKKTQGDIVNKLACY